MADEHVHMVIAGSNVLHSNVYMLMYVCKHVDGCEEGVLLHAVSTSVIYSETSCCISAFFTVGLVFC
jgi:hypothetical protein